MENAAILGDNLLIKKLHSQGVSVSEKFGGGTALHIAARNGKSETCKVLKELGAKVDEKDKVCKINIDSTKHYYCGEFSSLLISHTYINIY